MKRKSVSPPFMLKKKTTKRKKKAAPAPHKIQYSPYVPPVKKEFKEIIPITKIDENTLKSVVIGVAKSNAWSETKILLSEMKHFYLNYSQIGKILHRIPSVDDRVKAAEILKISLKDVPSNKFMFIQGFATAQERIMLQSIFETEMPERSQPEMMTIPED